MTPRTRSKTKFEVLDQEKVKRETTMAQEQNKGEELTLLKNKDDDVELIEALIIVQSGFMTPHKCN